MRSNLQEQALRHSSWANQHNLDSNEPLEFLGDAVLGLIVAEELHRGDPVGREGPKSARRASVVCREALAERFRATGFKVKCAENVRITASIEADAYEALVAAHYLEGGLEAAKAFWESGPTTVGPEDHKTRLQEILQGKKLDRPTYSSKREDGAWFASCWVSKALRTHPSYGAGATKKAAEQDAAKAMLKQLSR